MATRSVSQRRPVLSVLRVAAGVAPLLAGCAPGPERVYHQLGPGVQFDSKARSWDWRPGTTQSTGATYFQAPNVRELFFELVQQELAAKGYTRAAGGKADFVLDYSITRRAAGNPWDPSNDRYIVLLTIDIYDPSNSLRMWRGSAEAEADPNMPVDKLRALLTNTVAAILKPIPKRGSEPGGGESVVWDRCLTVPAVAAGG